MNAFGSLLKRPSTSLVGLDVSASAIKLVELGQDSRGGWVLERFASEPLSAGWITDGNIEKFDEVSAALRRLLRKCGTRAKNAALALPQSAVIAKRMTLPGHLSEEEMEVQVESEANHYIPFSLDEVSLDFCVIGPNAKLPSDVDVLLVASRKEKVQDMEALAQSAGLNPVVIDVDVHAARVAAARAMPREAGSQQALVALIKVEAEGTALQVLQGDEVLYDGEQGFGGGNQLAQMIARQYGMSLEEAELQRQSGDLPADYEVNVLQPFVQGLAQDIARSLQFFYTSSSYNRVDQVLLFGSLATVAGLDTAVSRMVGATAHTLNPFEGMTLAPSVLKGRLETDAPAYLEACGLAMRRFLS